MQTEAATTHWQLLEQYPGAHEPRLRAYVEVGRLLPAPVPARPAPAPTYPRRHAARLAGVDALLLPTAADVAPGRETTGDPSLQAPFSLVGFPSLSLPSGLSHDPKPAVGDSARRWAVAGGRLLAVGRWCEAQLPTMPRAAL